MGEKKKCSLCLSKHICIKLIEYMHIKNNGYKNKFSRKLCKNIKHNPKVMSKIIDLAILG